MTQALHKTYVVSFPRAGQHIVVRGLSWVIPDLVVYSENYCVQHNFSNNPAVNLQKEHDFDGELTPRDGYRYIVVFRDFRPSIQSWWRLTVGNGTTPDTEEHFRDFIVGKFQYWIRFHAKWTEALRMQPQPVIGSSFDLIMADPAGFLRQAVSFVTREIPVSLKYANSREQAYDSFAACCRLWQSVPKPPFPYNHVLEELGL